MNSLIQLSVNPLDTSGICLIVSMRLRPLLASVHSRRAGLHRQRVRQDDRRLRRRRTTHGTEQADVINGLGGRDELRGLGGDDILTGDTGPDQIEGGFGNDSMDGGSGDDNLDGGEGNDKGVGGFGHDVISGGPGDDVLEGNEAPDRVLGGDGNDTILGGSGGDDLFGGNGNDIIHSDTGPDRIDAGPGDDQVHLNSDPPSAISSITCGEGNDTVYNSPRQRADEPTLLAAQSDCETVIDLAAERTHPWHHLVGQRHQERHRAQRPPQRRGRLEQALRQRRRRHHLGRRPPQRRRGRQKDFMSGGVGDDTIYAGRGVNTVDGR